MNTDSVPPEAVPTFVCPHCGKVRSMAQPYLELTATQDTQLFLSTKICGECTKLLQEWLKK